MRRFSCVIAACAILGLSGCVMHPKPDYANFFDHQPRSILVIPPANKTTAVDAPAIFLTTVSAAFAERGYYVFPVFLVQDILNDLGASDEGAIAAIPPENLKEIFGTDSILYVTITDWTTSYIIIASNIIVGAEYRLVDASTGAVLWIGKQKVVHDSNSGGGSGGPIGALVVAAVKAAITATSVQYRPIAIQVNNIAAGQIGYGFPAGPYHPDSRKIASNSGKPPSPFVYSSADRTWCTEPALEIHFRHLLATRYRNKGGFSYAAVASSTSARLCNSSGGTSFVCVWIHH
jgi:hypothetical protein